MPIFPPPSDGYYTEKDYVAPTVFKKNGIGTSAGWNYYNTLGLAILKYKFLNNMPGGADVTPAGQVTFAPGTAAETMGINVDFYLRKSDGYWYGTTYKYLRGALSLPPIIFQFYTRAGSGPYFAIYDPNFFGMSATTIDSVDPDKLVELDGFYREVQLMKYRYNNLAAFLNELSKKILSPAEQQIFNEGTLKLQAMQGEVGSIRGIEITFNSRGAVGFVWLLIVIIIILAAATAWTITSIQAQREKTKQINDAYALDQWVANKKQEIALQVASGAISDDDAKKIYSTLDDATETANKVATNASKSNGSTLGQIGDILKWGVIGYIVFQGVSIFKASKTPA